MNQWVTGVRQYEGIQVGASHSRVNLAERRNEGAALTIPWYGVKVQDARIVVLYVSSPEREAMNPY